MQKTFPKDYLLSLERPSGYMGAQAFHDFDIDPDVERNFANSKELAHLRLLDENRNEDFSDEFLATLDSFVLAGAIKLYRTNETSGFSHHTMLVHETVRTGMQRIRLRRSKNYGGKPATLAERL